MADKLEIIITAKDNASGVLGKISGALGGMASLAGGVILNAVGNLASGASDFFTGSIDEAREAISNQKELAQVIESTGGIAGVSADEANSYAEALSKVTNFADDTILKGENMLLTFTNIGEDVFPRATAAMVDMGAKFGNIDTAAVQLGKALNDPIKGVGALSKIGVTFTEQQKEQIKAMVEAGDIAGAQGVILAELEKQVGGLAEAVADPAIQMQNAWADAKEEVGMAVIPILNKLAQIALPMISSAIQFVIPYIEKMGSWILGLIGYIEYVIETGDTFNDMLGDLPKSFEPVIIFIGETILALQNLVRYIVATVESGDSFNDWLTHFPEFLQPAILWIGNLIVAIQDLGAWILETAIPTLQEWGNAYVMPALDTFINETLPFLWAKAQEVWGWIQDTAIPTLRDWGTTFSETVVPIIQDFITNTLPLMWTKAQEIWTWIIDTAIPGLQEWGNSISEFLMPKFADLQILLDAFMVDILPLLQEAWETLATSWRDDISPALSELWTALQDLFETLGIGTGDTDTWKIALALLKSGLVVVTQKVRDWTPAIKAAADGLVFMIDMVKTGIEKFTNFKRGVEGIIGAVVRLIGKVKDMAERLASLVVPDWVLGNSPSPFELSLRGIASAMASMPDLQTSLNVSNNGALATASPLGGANLNGGSSFVVNFTYSPVVSLADKLEAETKILPFILDGIRKAKSSGQI